MTSAQSNRHRLLAVMTARALSCAAAAAITGRREATIRMYRSGARIVPDDVVAALEALIRVPDTATTPATD